MLHLTTGEMEWISIHALRVEGDTDRLQVRRCCGSDFYPRPPGGGRPSST